VRRGGNGKLGHGGVYNFGVFFLGKSEKNGLCLTLGVHRNDILYLFFLFYQQALF
jgi:hypothetical protein